MDAQKELITTVARNLRSERIRAGLSQQKLADKAGLSVRYISRLETNPQDFRISNVAVLAKALGIPPGRLLHRRGDRPMPPTTVETLEAAIRLLETVKVETEQAADG